MTSRRAFVLLGVLGVACAGPGCGRANLDAITRVPATGGSGGGGGGAIDGGGSGGSGSGGSVTCPSSVLPAGDTTETVLVGSTSRTYVLHIPAAYGGSKPVPLILDFHAQASSGSAERSSSPYPAQTDREGVVMAFPDGLRGPLGTAWNLGPCCVASTVDDVAFARAMVVQIQRRACIDPRRVYAVGTATGGGMAHYLACHAADVFAAVAPAAFDLVEENVGDCHPTRPITVLSFRGTADPLVPYEGGFSDFVPGMPVTLLGAQASFEKWAEIDQCTDPASAEDSNGCPAHSACQGGVEVVLCTKQGGGLEAGNASVAWPILKRHTL